MQLLFVPAYISFSFIFALAMNESTYLFQSPVLKAYNTAHRALANAVASARWRAPQIERPFATDRA